jgi:hypothetical protein
MEHESQDKLVQFALATLRILQAHEEWTADTTDEISDAAYTLGLACTDAETTLFTPTIDTDTH